MGCGISKRATSPQKNDKYDSKSNAVPKLTPADQALGDAGKYTITGKVVGKGGFAVVRLGARNQTGEPIAIKTVRQVDGVEDEGIWYSFVTIKAEAHLLSQLRHNNVVKFIDFVEAVNEVEHAHTRYLIMEYLNGMDLGSALEKKQTYIEGESQKWASDILNGLQYLHDQDVVHRDIKMDNLIVVESGTVKLIDFGFATQIPKGHQGGKLYSFLGTIGYEAPEIVNRRPYDGKAYDMWSFGVVLFIMLCGRPPFDDGGDETLVNERISRNEWSFPPGTEERIPKAARELVKCLLVSDPKERLTAGDALEHAWFTLPSASFNLAFMASTDEWGDEAPAELNKDMSRVSSHTSGGILNRSPRSRRSFKHTLDEIHHFSHVRKIRSARHVSSASVKFVAAQKENFSKDGMSAADWGTRVANESIKRVGSYGPILSDKKISPRDDIEPENSSAENSFSDKIPEKVSEKIESSTTLGI